MDLGLKGKAAAVAAASKGLGRGAAEAFAREGCDVAICARGEDALATTTRALEAYGVRVVASVEDLTQPGACERFVEGAASALGRLDVLVANVGGPPPSLAQDADPDAMRAALEQNLVAPLRLVRAALPSLRASGAGRIVAITSQAQKEPLEGLGPGNAARAGIASYLKTLSREVAGDGITVNVAAPGPHRTDRLMHLSRARADAEGIDIEEAMAAFGGAIPTGALGDPGDFGALVAFLASDKARFITGQTIVVDGGLSRSLQ